MKAFAWRWLALLAIPGCVLVQPLDEAKPADSDNAGSGNGSSHAGSSNAGSASGGRSGGPAKAGSGNAGSSASGGADGGAPSGVDFSLFTGTWTIVDGKNTTTCDSGASKTSNVDPGGQDTFGLGTITDLILDPGTTCEVLADVDDHRAFLNSNTAACSYSDASYDYDLFFDAFEFIVSSDGKTAKASMTAYITATDASGNMSDCKSDTTWNYKR